MMRRSRPAGKSWAGAFAICGLVAGSVAAADAGQVEMTAGVFRTADEFQRGVLADPVACAVNGERINAGTSKGQAYIDVRHGTRKARYSETDAYGFRDCGDRDVRITSGRQYFILETRHIQVLRVDQWRVSGKALVPQPAFYFSVGASGAIQPLTLENVKRAFPENHAFHDKLDALFSGGGDPATYDRFHGMFAINHLLDSTWVAR